MATHGVRLFSLVPFTSLAPISSSSLRFLSFLFANCSSMHGLTSLTLAVHRRIKISKTPTLNSSSKPRNTKNRSPEISVGHSRSTATSRILENRAESVRRISSTSSRRIRFTMRKWDTRKVFNSSLDRYCSTLVDSPPLCDREHPLLSSN